jgi:hypothetical protein
VTDVARLEALLTRVRENRAKPRPPHARVTPESADAALDERGTVTAISLETKEFSPSAHDTIHGLPAPTFPQPSAPVTLEPVVAPRVAAPTPPSEPDLFLPTFDEVAEATPAVDAPLIAREPEPLAPTLDAPAPLVAQEPEPFAAIPAEPFAAIPAEPFAAIPAEPFAAIPAEPFAAIPAEPFAAIPAEPAPTQADEPLLSVLPAAFDELDELEETPHTVPFDELDEPGTSVPPPAFVQSAMPPATASTAAVPVPPSAISPPSEPIARIAAALPEPVPTTFGGLMRRTLALRPR